MIQETLEPYQKEIDPDTLRRLAIAMSLIVGVEARIVLRDIWHLEDEYAEQILRWIARTLAQATVTQRHKT
jgi:hypothetical protein